MAKTKNFVDHLDGKLVDYAAENDFPVKIRYNDGSEEEGLFLKKIDVYNYLVHNPEESKTYLIHKNNVIKIEIMGDVADTLEEEY